MTEPTREELRRRNLERFREACRREQIGARYSGGLHLAVINAVYIASFVAGLYAAGPARGDALWLIPAAWVTANLGEYFLHRGPMHHKPKRMARLYLRHAATHHRFFTDASMSVDTPRDYAIIFFPAWMHAFFVFGLGLPILLVVGALLGFERACVFAAGVASYIWAYEWLHLAAHLPRRLGVESIPVMGAIARHHRRHHDPARMRHVNFSIFFPLGDLLFGTLTRSDTREANERNER